MSHQGKHGQRNAGKIAKCNQRKHDNQWVKHKAGSLKSRGGCKGNFITSQAHKEHTGTWRTKCVCQKRIIDKQKAPAL